MDRAGRESIDLAKTYQDWNFTVSFLLNVAQSSE